MEEEFYVNINNLNDAENGGVSVLTGKRVILFSLNTVFD